MECHRVGMIAPDLGVVGGVQRLRYVAAVPRWGFRQALMRSIDVSRASCVRAREMNSTNSCPVICLAGIHWIWELVPPDL
jgi:hypothetical protein